MGFLKTWWAKAAAFVAPLAAKAWGYAKPLAVSFLVGEVKKQTLKLRQQAKDGWYEAGVPGINKAFDGWQARIEGYITASRIIPESLKAKAVEIIEDEGNKAQAVIINKITIVGPGGIDFAFDSLDEFLVERIGKL